jgi:hypothetical protein
MRRKDNPQATKRRSSSQDGWHYRSRCGQAWIPYGLCRPHERSLQLDGDDARQVDLRAVKMRRYKIRRRNAIIGSDLSKRMACGAGSSILWIHRDLSNFAFTSSILDVSHTGFDK